MSTVNSISTFVINLPRSRNRRKIMEEQLERLGIRYTIFPATDGRALPAEDTALYSRAMTIAIHGRELSPGELGAALSHLKIYRHMVENNVAEALILEDDIYIGEMFRRIVNLRDRIPDDWELFTFSDSESLVPYGDPLTDIYRLCRNSGRVNGSYAYMIKLSGARKLIEHAHPIRFCPDGLTGRTEMTGIVMYGVAPAVVSLCNVESDIWSMSARPGKVSRVKRIMISAWGKLIKSTRR